MAYSDFTFRDIKDKLGLTLQEREPLFVDLAAVECSQHLAETLRYNVPLALAISTEKARSELIVTPVLVEMLKMLPQQISFFSGIEFNIDKSQGLNGICDYIISLSPEQLELNAPAITIVEAKNDNIKIGYAQCIAEMYAASLYNAAKQKPLQNIYGVVTTGSLWSFLKLHEQTVHIDRDEYHISNIGIILSIFMTIIDKSSHAA
jgi:hypothetical protein